MGEGETVMHNSSYTDRHSQSLGLPHQESGVWKVGSFLRPSRSSLQLELGSCDLYCCRTAILLGILRPERIMVVVAEFVSENYRTWFNQGSRAHAMWLRQQHRPTGIMLSRYRQLDKSQRLECINSLQRPELSLLVNNELMRNGAQV